MAERIVSPGVFTREKDLSFLPQGISEIGAAIVGPTIQGPSFVPTVIRNFEEFEKVFGSYSTDYYTPYTVKNYLDSAGTVTIVKVGYLGGYATKAINLIVSTSGADNPTNVVAATFIASNLNSEGLGTVSASLSGDAVLGNFGINFVGGGVSAVTASLSNLTLVQKGSAAGGDSESSGKYIKKQIPRGPYARKIG